MVTISFLEEVAVRRRGAWHIMRAIGSAQNEESLLKLKFHATWWQHASTAPLNTGARCIRCYGGVGGTQSLYHTNSMDGALAFTIADASSASCSAYVVQIIAWRKRRD
jgi:hypothetical protein